MKDTAFPHYRLDQWTSMRLQLLWAYQKEMGESGGPSVNTFHFQTAALVRQGWAEIGHTESQRLRAEAGQWLIFKQGRRWQRFSADCVLLSIGYRFQLPTGEAIFDEGLPLRLDASRYPQLAKEAEGVLKRMKRHVGEGYLLLKQRVDMRDYLLSQNALRTFLVELAAIFHEHQVIPKTMDQANPHVIQALALINSISIAVDGKPIKTRDIAREVGLSPTHLDRLMVAETGYTVFQHRDARRRLMAEDALIANRDSLKAISYALGFSSAAHFSSWFKKRHGKTPLQVRNSGPVM